MGRGGARWNRASPCFSNPKGFSPASVGREMEKLNKQKAEGQEKEWKFFLGILDVLDILVLFFDRSLPSFFFFPLTSLVFAL